LLEAGIVDEPAQAESEAVESSMPESESTESATTDSEPESNAA
jgi:hypothetical protein